MRAQLFSSVVVVLISISFRAGVVAAPFDAVELPPPPTREETPRQEPPASQIQPIDAAAEFGERLIHGENKNEIPAIKSSSSYDHPSIVLAVHAMAAGKADEGLRHLQVAVSDDPALPPEVLLMAELYLASGRLAEGRQCLEKAAVFYKDHPQVYELAARLALAEGRHADAWANFELATRLKAPDGWDAQRTQAFRARCTAGLAAVSEARADWSTSVELFTRWNELGKLSANDHTRWAKSLLQAGQIPESLEQLKQAHARDTLLNPPELALASMLTENNNFEEAKKWYEAAEKKYADDERVYFEFAGALLLAGKSDAAQEKLDLLESKAKQKNLQLDIALLRGLIARSQKQYAAAEAKFTLVLKEIPGHPTALQQLPLVLVEQASDTKRNKALQIALIHAQRQPQSAAAQSTLGWVQFRLGKPEAEDTLVTAASLPGCNAETLYYTAQALMAAGKAEQCGPYLEALRERIAGPQLFVLRSEAQEWLDTLVLAIPK